MGRPMYDDLVNTPRTKAAKIGETLPNARVLAAQVLEFNPVESELSTAFTYFSQFVSHDLVGTPDDGKECFCDKVDPACFNIPILAVEKEPAFVNQLCIPMRRNLNSKIADLCHVDHREQMSKNTHWLDNDNIYGISGKDLEKLRTGQNGLLKSSNLPNSKFEGLPINDLEQCVKPGKSYGCFFAGDDRLENSVMLTTMHTVII